MPARAFAEARLLLDAAKGCYDSGANDFAALGKIGSHCLNILQFHAQKTEQAVWHDHGRVVREYDVFRLDGKVSRPVRRDLWIDDRQEFDELWAVMTADATPGCLTLSVPSLNELLYTCVMAVCCAFDLLQPSSRKTPGTFFEIVTGTVAGQVAGLARGKQVKVPGKPYTVPTDIVFERRGGGGGLVLPTKITTRERIVQPWAQQRILDAVFGVGNYQSVLVCVSETQRDAEKGVNEICVPHQVGLFQEYLARMSGLYYLDPPLAYVRAPFARADFPEPLKVGTLADLLSADLRDLAIRVGLSHPQPPAAIA